MCGKQNEALGSRDDPGGGTVGGKYIATRERKQRNPSPLISMLRCVRVPLPPRGISTFSRRVARSSVVNIDIGVRGRGVAISCCNLFTAYRKGVVFCHESRIGAKIIFIATCVPRAMGFAIV